MTTTTFENAGRTERREERIRARVKVGRIGIGTVAVLAILVSAWGGIVPFVGPLFGYAATNGGSWHWSLAHSLLALVPGAVGVAISFILLTETRGITLGRGRVSLSAAGFLLLMCGAWFVLGPVVWPVITTTHGGYFVAASPLRSFVNQLGYNLGTGVVLAACGGFVTGWAARHGATETAPEGPIPEVAS